MNKDGYFSILVAEDEQIILEDIIEKIEKADTCFKVAASALDGEDALRLIEQLRPDVLFTDIRMPVMNGLELIRNAKKIHPDIHVVIISGYDEFSYAQQAIKLGVTDYLLKPLHMESLVETIIGIKNKLVTRINVMERNILSHRLNGIKPSESLPSSFENSRFTLFLICLGNLYSRAAVVLDKEYFSKLWDRVEWVELIHSCFDSSVKWWVIDENLLNQKFLIIANENDCSHFTTGTTEKVMNFITEIIQAAIPVTICSDETPVDFTSIWETAHTVRGSLEKGLVPCRSSVINPEVVKPFEVTKSYSNSLTMNTLEKFIKQNQIDYLNNELKKMFTNWIECHYPQKHLEKVLVQLVRNILEQHGWNSFSVLDSVELELYEIVALSNDPDTFYYDILQLLNNYFLPDKLNESSEELYIKLEEYIRLNFSKPINVDFLAEKFNFSPSYIIRVFKKYKKDTPMQYLISLRIKEAKRLIENNPDLDFKYISEIIGYTDQHYFSRVFKKTTGMSPSDYKECIASIRKNSI